MTTSDTGRELLWAPSEERVRASRMTAYLDWLGRERGLRFAAYEDLWRWSVEDLDGFWRSIWDYFDVLASAPPTAVLDHRRMPGATRWTATGSAVRASTAARCSPSWASNCHPCGTRSWSGTCTLTDRRRLAR